MRGKLVQVTRLSDLSQNGESFGKNRVVWVYEEVTTSAIQRPARFGHIQVMGKPLSIEGQYELELFDDSTQKLITKETIIITSDAFVKDIEKEFLSSFNGTQITVMEFLSQGY